MFEASVGTFIVALAICVGVGLPLWAVRYQKPKLPEHEPTTDVDHQREGRR